MKIGELKKALEQYDSEADIKVIIRGGNYYEIIDIEIGKYIGDGILCPKYVRLVASSWDVKKPNEPTKKCGICGRDMKIVDCSFWVCPDYPHNAQDEFECHIDDHA
ncbi:MAG: hypothetical protein KAJ03_11645 [Gammaproteobacteria bacterium]|nr:hypothetical protein [Gammaproteobacteria bacterium]